MSRQEAESAEHGPLHERDTHHLDRWAEHLVPDTRHVPTCVLLPVCDPGKGTGILLSFQRPDLQGV